jgi:flagellar biosynthetic protein FlhB
MAGEDQTEAASGRRLERARAEGNVPVSRELTALAVMAATAMVLMMQGPSLARALVLRLQLFLEQPDRLDVVLGLRMAAGAALLAAAPFVLAALAAGAAAVLLQTGFLLNLSALMPDLGRLHPRHGLRRLGGKATLVEAGKSVLKLGVVGWAGWQATARLLPELPQSMGWGAELLTGNATRQVVHILLAMLAAQAVIAVLDVVRARWQHASDLRMSRQELRDEHRESEGDPKIKQRIRQIRQTRARRRMMAEVPKATVVVTNPTHYAVALAYDRTNRAAPRVVAKGVDEMAARIRVLARDSGVPVVANPPLARALHLVKLDGEIPAEHYKAVAELIAYVWRLRGRAGPLPAASAAGP